MTRCVVQLGYAIEAGAFAAWLRSAAVGEEIVYAHGLVLPSAQGAVVAARGAGEAGRVHLFQRRLPADAPRRGFEWVARRRSDPAPTPVAAPVPASAEPDEAEAAVLRLLRRAARLGQVAPTNAELARGAELKNAEAARYIVSKLIRAGAIRVEDQGPRARRIVTICATGARTVAGRL